MRRSFRPSVGLILGAGAWLAAGLPAAAQNFGPLNYPQQGVTPGMSPQAVPPRQMQPQAAPDLEANRNRLAMRRQAEERAQLQNALIANALRRRNR